jgi:hypothetical protein
MVNNVEHQHEEAIRFNVIGSRAIARTFNPFVMKTFHSRQYLDILRQCDVPHIEDAELPGICFCRQDGTSLSLGI